MMPSVIPARLQFQCGHAALVTLPRVKGETATQRNDRVAREKLAALSRQCDFCAPVCAPANGAAYVESADALELEKTSPVEELAIIVAAEPQAVTPEPEAVPVAQEQLTLAEEPVAVIPEPVVAAAIEAEVLEAVPVEAVNGTNGHAPKPVRKARARRSLKTTEMAARGQRFLVEYRLERVLRADSIREALRQVASYGPGEVVAITRED